MRRRGYGLTKVPRLGTLPLLTRHEGHFLEKVRACQVCGSTWTAFEEKMSDVNLATHLLLEAVDDRFDTALVVSGDSDLSTPIRTVLRRWPHKRVVVAFPPKRNSVQLQGVATGYLRIGEDKLRKSQLPDSVQTVSGILLHRLKEWR
jgi:uncharacterized LabA/DUF88 family protein